MKKGFEKLKKSIPGNLKILHFLESKQPQEYFILILRLEIKELEKNPTKTHYGFSTHLTVVRFTQ